MACVGVGMGRHPSNLFDLLNGRLLYHKCGAVGFINSCLQCGTCSWERYRY